MNNSRQFWEFGSDWKQSEIRYQIHVSRELPLTSWLIAFADDEK